MASQASALLLAVLIGLSLGALGSGGSIVTLPILVYVAGIAPKSAVGISMPIVGGTSFLGGYFHWRQGNLLPRLVFLFSITGILGAYMGSAGTHAAPSSVLMLLFAALMVVVGLLMVAGKEAASGSGAVCSAYRCISAGLVVGLVTGFLGVGGGFLIVTALIWFAGLDTRSAIGTSLGIIAVNSVAGLVGQLRYTDLNWTLTGEFLLCSLIGMGLGIPIARSVPERNLKKAFAVVVLAVAGAIGFQELGHR